MTARPNILYLHSHDTGRFVQPYGHQVPTPNIQRLADQGMLFREAFCAAPTCSGSRAALLTGQWTHTNGMTGLAHRGWTLNDYSHHLVHTLRRAGYWSGLIGEQHLSVDTGVLGYDRVVDIDTTHVETVAPAAVALLREHPPQPFFLSVGFFETHREYFPPTSIRDSLYSLPPGNLPDTPETRQDMASYKASARSLDQGVGAVLNALDEYDIADDTLVILTTDHGLAFPGAKATLTDRGIGVLLIMRGPGGFHGGRVSEALVSQIDLYPTICELVGIDAPDFLQGRSILPVMRKETARSTTRSSPSSPTTPPMSRSARSAPSAGSTSAASATATCRCSPTSTTVRPRTSSFGTAGPTGRCRARSCTTFCSIPPRHTTWPTSRRTPACSPRCRGAWRHGCATQPTRCSTATSLRRPARC